MIPYSQEYLEALEVLLQTRYDLIRLEYETKVLKQLTDWILQKRDPKHFRCTDTPAFYMVPRSRYVHSLDDIGLVGVLVGDVEVYTDIKGTISLAQAESQYQACLKNWDKIFKHRCAVLDRWDNIPEDDNGALMGLYLKVMKELDTVYPKDASDAWYPYNTDEETAKEVLSEKVKRDK